MSVVLLLLYEVLGGKIGWPFGDNYSSFRKNRTCSVGGCVYRIKYWLKTICTCPFWSSASLLLRESNTWSVEIRSALGTQNCCFLQSVGHFAFHVHWGIVVQEFLNSLFLPSIYRSFFFFFFSFLIREHKHMNVKEAKHIKIHSTSTYNFVYQVRHDNGK
jgi:hypothetical protein